MKLKTLAWWQIVIGLLLFHKSFSVITSGESLAYEIGATAYIYLTALFALLTGIYNLKQKK
tara:strand:- start:1430 stop:1612 length:183 start_codon:yes stop_codon:yes gene_type:complete